MGRSLYGMLHRRYGRRPTGAELKRRAEFHRERLRGLLPLGLLEAPKSAAGASPGSVAVVGGGLAGATAAFTLDLLGFDVTVFDGGCGGRVSTSSTLVPNRLLETGAELIGTNHPLWLLLADFFGLGMSVVTTDDNFGAQGLQTPLILDDTVLNSFQQQALYEEMSQLFLGWCSTANSSVPNPWVPWAAPGAAVLDSSPLRQYTPDGGWLHHAVRTTFLFNNLQTLEDQSWLANLAQFAAGTALTDGDPTGFFDDTEVFRCASGNQSLLQALLGAATIVSSNVTDLDTSNGNVILTLAGGEPGGTFDYAVFAAPVSVFPVTTVDGGSPFPWQAVQSGYACKYLAPQDTRFWIPQGQAPSGMFDLAGMTWEATDNQMALPGATGPQYCLTLFTGGPIAEQAVKDAQQGTAGFPDQYFGPMLELMYPGFVPPAAGGAFCCGSGGIAPYLMSGYSCPAVNEVTTTQMSYATPHNGVVFLAGEHTSPAWFGFMEGALESGLSAAVRVAVAAGVEIPAQAGGLEGALVATLVQDAADLIVGEATQV